MDHSQLIRQMLDNIESDNAAAAQENFDNLMSARINDLLDQRKQVIAQNFGTQESEDTEI
jgi:nucleoid DNA-binding protein